MAQQVLIEFLADYSDIENAQQVLERTGAIDKNLSAAFSKTNQELRKQATGIKQVANELKGPIKSIDQLDARSKKFVQEFIKGFEQGVVEELKLAKSEIDLFKKRFEESGKAVGKSQDNVKQKLRATITEMQNLQAAGQGNSERFKELERLAGEYGDALDEVNAKVRNSRDGERSINRLVEASTALVGGFTAVQGAAALFSGQNEELEKTLVKVNGAMAVLQGLQAITTAIQSDGAITLALLNIQQKISLAQTNLETAATSKNIVVKYAAIAAQKALNLVMAANPFGLVAVAIAAVVVALANYTRGAREAAAETARLNNAADPKRFDAEVEALQRAGRLRTAQLKANGAAESEISRENINNERRIQQARIREFNAVNETLKGIQDKSTDEYKAALERRNQLERDINEANTAGQIASIELTAAARQEAEDKAREAAEKREAAEAKRQEAERARLTDSIARLKTEQLAFDETTQAYSRTEAAIIRLQAAYDSVGASAAQAAFIQAKAAQDIEKELARTAPRGREVAAQLQDVTQVQAGATTKALEGIKQAGSAAITTVANVTQSAGQRIQSFLEQNSQLIGDTVGALQTVAGGLQAVAQEDERNTQQRLENKRLEVDALLESGAITEKEAAARQKKIDQEEKRAQLAAAKRQKELAIFGAVVNTIQGVTQALASLPPPFNFIQAGIIAAFGFAQVAKIKQRPLPKFAVGKKGTWEGLGIMGEAGTEMKVGPDGSLFIADKPTTVYVGRQDKIYTAAETKKMLPALNFNLDGSGRAPAKVAPGGGIDYGRLEKMLASRGPAAVVNIDRDFISHAVANGLYRFNYMQRRYRFKA